MVLFIRSSFFFLCVFALGLICAIGLVLEGNGGAIT